MSNIKTSEKIPICPQNFKLMIANTSDFNSPVLQEFKRVQSEENSCSVRGRFTGKFINFALTVSLISTKFKEESSFLYYIAVKKIDKNSSKNYLSCNNY